MIIASPHFVQGHIFFLPKAYGESFVIFLLLVCTGLVYIVDKRSIDKKQKEKLKLEEEIHISTEKINDAFQYIGQVNRQLPLLKNITTDLLSNRAVTKQSKKEIMHSLLMTATVSLSHADWGLLRFIEISHLRTHKEFVHSRRKSLPPKMTIGNKELLQTPVGLCSVDDLYIVQTSDQKADIRGYFIFPKNDSFVEKNVSVLQTIVDQSQVFYHYLYEQGVEIS